MLFVMHCTSTSFAYVPHQQTPSRSCSTRVQAGHSKEHLRKPFRNARPHRQKSVLPSLATLKKIFIRAIALSLTD